jgi:3-oxoadipate enol-lactonase
MKRAIISSASRLGITWAGQGPLVLFVHGMGGDRSAWHKQIEALQGEFTAVSVDLRGYGESDDPPHALDFKQDFADDLIAVIDHFSVPRAHLVGLSMGGRVVRATSLIAPERVASVTLANTSPGFDGLSQAEMNDFIEKRSAVGDGIQLPEDFGLKQAKAMMAPDTSPVILALAATAIQRLRLPSYLEILKASTLQDRGDKLEDIKAPALIITSDQDRVYPSTISARMQELIPNASLTILYGAGHLSNLEKPQAFNEALLEFLRKLPVEKNASSTLDLNHL